METDENARMKQVLNDLLLKNQKIILMLEHIYNLTDKLVDLVQNNDIKAVNDVLIIIDVTSDIATSNQKFIEDAFTVSE